MTQRFDIIPIEDYGVVVDKVSPNNEYGIAKRWRGLGGYEVFPNCSRKDGWKIIATIGKRIEGLPLMELPDEAEREWEKDNDYKIDNPTVEGIMKNMFLDGYKAAQSKGYSEEDIIKAFYAGRGWTNRFQDWKWEDATEYIQSLQKNKLPVAVELEMEKEPIATSKQRFQDTGDIIVQYRVKITDPETNTIKPVNVFYE